MATITPKITFAYEDNSREGWKVVWGPLALNDIGDPGPAQFIGWADRSIQVEGTFGASGQLKWETSNDSVNYHVARDPFGNPMTFNGADLIEVTECSMFTRPHVTAGDGTTSLTVTCLFRRTKP